MTMSFNVSSNSAKDLDIHFVNGPLWSQISSYIVLCLIVLINSWQIIILKNRGRKTSFDKLLLSLSSCELMMGIVSLTIAVALRIETLKPYHVLFQATLYIFNSCVALSEYFHLIAITFDRTLAVVTPLKHRSYVTNKRTIFICMICWVIPIVWVFIYVAVFLLKGSFSSSMEDYYRTEFCFHSSILTICVDIIFIVCYGIIIHTISRRSQNPVGESNRVQNQHAKTLFLCISYSAVFLIATIPFVILFLVPHRLSNWTVNSIVSLFTLNSFFNSTVFLVQHYYRKRQAISRIEGS